MKAKARKPKKIKMKTKKTYAKRTKVTGSGKVEVRHNYVSHFAANKSHKQKKHLAAYTGLDKTDAKRNSQLLQG
ncbi:50S ribosomal protein L35 [Erysipelotrichaceae bacterium Oil+RF-744-GAM-WT-6]|jgi:large subunit ribosomal protein L35|uniref:Large ribosomal subunit protein bL35 n=1 Tax=Stecheria intestinalis TaxID=2606630 RepID=A0A7X2TF97_9FIRM|nr:MULTISPECIES: 50S ribosomal protein L35 [Erysipelotrichaceae]MCI2153267.1 50S ribosomal protein L35 [Solobacterium sp.]MDY3233985.1 50S ribosomal protein L35 [Erysipelotrichaceae bacterium]MDY4680779.1 50S ribosomal protein L35 [Lachnospiraceae bacterium]MCI6746466.1 50S ribosomal protein L35 [Anaerolactibacter massiliensis]MDD5880641.1 50S ribosomal protein L35 [Stecheria intestinalis]